MKKKQNEKLIILASSVYASASVAEAATFTNKIPNSTISLINPTTKQTLQSIESVYPDVGKPQEVSIKKALEAVVEEAKKHFHHSVGKSIGLLEITITTAGLGELHKTMCRPQTILVNEDDIDKLDKKMEIKAVQTVHEGIYVTGCSISK